MDSRSHQTTTLTPTPYAFTHCKKSLLYAGFRFFFGKKRELVVPLPTTYDQQMNEEAVSMNNR